MLRMLNIVLIEPQIPQNTGNIARTCAVTGSRLHLVRPMGFTVDDKKLKRAGLDYWHMLDIVYHSSSEAFFESEKGPFFFSTTKAEEIYTGVTYPENSYLVFGREDAGLPEALLGSGRGACIRIPQCTGARSLNLSNAVAVVTFEALRQQGFPGMILSGGLYR